MDFQALIQKIEQINLSLIELQKAAKEDNLHAQNWQNKMRLEWNYAANYLSGGTFSKEEIANLTDEKADYSLVSGLKKYERKELYEIILHDKMMLNLLDGSYKERKISVKFLQELHKNLIFEPQEKQKRTLIGKWRNTDNQILNYRQETIYFSHYKNIDSEIHFLLEDWGNYLIQKKENSTSIHCIEKIAQFHLDFLQIHPFYDGNGRVARFVMNIMLEVCGYPFLVIGEAEKREYERTLALAQAYKKMPQHFYTFIATLILENAQMQLRYLSGSYFLNKQAEMFSRLQQLKQKLSSTNEKIESRKENVNWQTDFLPFLRNFLVNLEEKTVQFSELFFETKRIVSFFYLDSSQDWVHKEIFSSLDFKDFPPILSLNNCTFSYVGKQFRYHLHSPFSVSIDILKIVFQPYSYQILCRKGEGMFVFETYPYHKFPNEKEISDIFAQVCEAILKRIEENNR